MEFTLSPQFLVLVPIVVGLVSLLKQYINVRWAPLLSLVFGILSTFLLKGTESIQIVILSGIVVGLMASGLYSGVKTTAQG